MNPIKHSIHLHQNYNSVWEAIKVLDKRSKHFITNLFRV
nr:MAG TPA: hypothetical protein [Bacteriophage sp.]